MHRQAHRILILYGQKRKRQPETTGKSQMKNKLMTPGHREYVLLTNVYFWSY